MDKGKIHFVGVGGIGMSGLVAMCQSLGWQTSGSDRGADKPENARIIGALRRQGVKIYAQDGSFAIDGLPDFLVYSTAIEEGNPDFVAGKNVPRLHRSQLLEKLLASCGKTTIAVTGSCGKSSVTAYMAEALLNAGKDPSCLNGALSKRFATAKFAGNYRGGFGDYLVFEADESDKSLLNYGADYCIILNMGTDHYDKNELARVFAEFLQGVRCGAVLEQGVYEAVRDKIPKNLPIAIFSATSTADARYSVVDYQVCNGVPQAKFSNGAMVKLPQPGFHTALNALAVLAMLEMLGVSEAEAIGALERFDGVWRRSDFAGKTANGVPVYDDYAHNPEKIRSCLRTMRELGNGKLLAVFQPHGYGPFGFMRDCLFQYLEEDLRDGDKFYLLEPFYAGGTSSFKPSAKEVWQDWTSRSANPNRYVLGLNRDDLRAEILNIATAGDVLVIMGARDNSLSDYAKSFVDK